MCGHLGSVGCDLRMARKATRRKVRYDGIDAVDLFCGGGGLTCGLRQTGIDVRMGVDFDGRCEYAYEQRVGVRGEC